MLFLSTHHNRIDKKGTGFGPGAVSRGAGDPRTSRAWWLTVSPVHHLHRGLRHEPDHVKLNEKDGAASTRIPRNATHSPRRCSENRLQLSFDTEGRVMLPEALMTGSGPGRAMRPFVGKGEVFEIWEPKAFADYAQKAKRAGSRAALSAEGGCMSAPHAFLSSFPRRRESMPCKASKRIGMDSRLRGNDGGEDL